MRTPHRAFTLIELLVVVTIIVVLLALLTPALDKSIAEAEKAACGSNLHGIGNATMVYAVDLKNRLPASQPNGVADFGNPAVYKVTPNFLGPLRHRVQRRTGPHALQRHQLHG